MTSYSIDGLPTHAELDHDTRGWERGDVVPIVGWMFVSTFSINAALYPVIDPKPPHTVQAVLYDDWWPAEDVPKCSTCGATDPKCNTFCSNIFHFYRVPPGSSR